LKGLKRLKGFWDGAVSGFLVRMERFKGVKELGFFLMVFRRWV
jgi:hypothetical protein